MKFKDFALTPKNHFIAMQYYGLILNRTFLVLLHNDKLIGIKVNGMVSTKVEMHDLRSLMTAEIVNSMAINGDLRNPFSYVKFKYIKPIQDCELEDGSIVAANKANFIISRKEIKNVWHDPRKKWGMAEYPHDGKVYLETTDGKKREFIIMGNQDGRAIADRLMS